MTQLRTIHCNTHVYTFHVCLCLLALTFVCNFTYLMKCSFQIYQKNIVVFIKSSSVWFKTTWCAKGPVTRCNFLGNLQRNSTLKRCKLVANVWYVKWNLYFMYYEIPVPWVHHNLCNGMECSKHSMVKWPYLFSTCNMDGRNIKFVRTHNLVRQDYSRWYNLMALSLMALCFS